MRFINYKLFIDLGMKYPPEYLVEEKNSLYLNTAKVQELQKQARKKFDQGNSGQDKYVISEEFKETPEMKKLTQKEDHLRKQRSLYSKCVFLLNRETPIYSLQYLILSFGGAFVTDEDESYLKKHKITHHVIDRPLLGQQDSTREYVQPQWVVDSLNSLFLLPNAPYRPGVAPPPHLSPFIDNSKEGYVPTRQREINQLKGEDIEDVDEEEAEESEEEQVVQPVLPVNNKSKQQASKGDADSSSDEESEEEVQKLKQIKNKKLKSELKKEEQELGKILMTKK